MDELPILDTEPDADAPRKSAVPRDANPHDFSAVEEALNEAAKRVNAVWISFILLCVYIFIATYTVTPATLFRDAPVKMPIFNADLPLKVYFVMAPVLILALHFYLIVLTKGLSEKIDAYEDVRSFKIASDRRALRARLDNSIIIRTLSSQHRDAHGGVDHASRFVGRVTMFVMPAGLLLLTQLIFLPYQNEVMTMTHRIFIIGDFLLCLWLTWPLVPRSAYVGRLMAAALVFIAAVTSVIFAAFPGEDIYEALTRTWAHEVTVWLFEGPTDPVDYIRRSGNRWFPNRLILPDDPKLAEIAGASSGGVSLSVRGRNFRKAVFDRSNLARVDFSAADLEEASLQGAKLEGAKFKCATRGTFNTPDYENKTPMSWEEEDRDCAKLKRANLSTANLDGAVFRGARMNGTIVESADVKNADFGKTELLGARFNNVHGGTANFSGALLMGADFQNAQLLASNFTGAGLQGARFSGSTLQAADVSNAYMQGVDMSGASLQGASFENTFLHAATLDYASIQGASFKGAALPDASLECDNFFRSGFENSDRVRTSVTARTEQRCKTGWGWEYFGNSTSYDIRQDDIRDKYNLPTDALPKEQEGKFGSTDIYPNNFSAYDTPLYYSYDTFIHDLFTQSEKLGAETFVAALDKLTSDLPDDAKARVARAFERLKPDPKKKADDDAEKARWADWANKSPAEQSALQENHAKALAARLEHIACVAEGAPYVARGLLRAGRFALLAVDEKANEEKKARIKRINERNLGILDRLRKASGVADRTCPGAIGLVEADFPKPAPAK